MAPHRVLRPCRRAPYRIHFVDHPGYAAKDPQAFAGDGHIRDKLKIWCRLCLDQRVQETSAHEQEEVQRGVRPFARNVTDIMAECKWCLVY